MKKSTNRTSAAVLLIAAALTTSLRAEAQSRPRRPIIVAASDTSNAIEADTLQDVVVTSAGVNRRLSQKQAGAEKIDMKELSSLPAIFGERDVMKSIQLLPGVKSDGDGSSGYQVRGGTTSQNIVLLDNAIVYNSGHLMGLFSSFNDDALAAATLYKGNSPARLGGGVSSVFEIGSRQGNLFNHHVSAGVGLLAARLAVEGPIREGESSYLVAARRSYLDLFLRMTDNYSDTKLNFYDVNAKLAWRLGEKDNLSLSFIRASDEMEMLHALSMEWSNMAASLRWFHTFSPSVFLTTWLTASKYTSDAGMKMASDAYTINGFVRHAALNVNLNWTPSEAHRIQCGWQSQLVGLRSAEWEAAPVKEREQRSAWQNDAWLQDDWTPSEQLQIGYGLRLNVFTVLGGPQYYQIDDEGEIVKRYDTESGQNVKTRVYFEPRLNVNFNVNDELSLKAAYTRTSQNIHAIRTSTATAMPIDRYTMTSNIVRPMLANQVSLGATIATARHDYDLAAEVYYKHIDNVYDYRDGMTWMSWIEMERLILGGKGRSYGAEICLHKNDGPLTGWISYTLSWSENKIKGISNDDWYTASNDRRHDFSIVGTYALNMAWTLSATWVFNTGQALTAPSAKYDNMGDTFYYYAKRNGYRAPAYHRLDISATHKKQLSAKVERQLSFGFYNIYNRKNPYMVIFENDDDKPSGTKATKVSLFGLVPSISYLVKF